MERVVIMEIDEQRVSSVPYFGRGQTWLVGWCEQQTEPGSIVSLILFV